MNKKMVYMEVCKGAEVRDDVEIMVFRNADLEWDVYYRKEHYPFIFAFGVEYWRDLEEVMEIAIGNVNTPNCKVLFDEEE